MVAYDGKKPYVFVSYSHKDTELVFPVIEQLQQRGYRVWYDGGIEVGSEWPQYIADHIDDSAVVLNFVSINYENSHNCRRELTYALNAKKPFLSVYLVDALDQLSGGLRMQLGLNQAIWYNVYNTLEEFCDALTSANILDVCRDKRFKKSVTKASATVAEEIAPKEKQASKKSEASEEQTNAAEPSSEVTILPETNGDKSNLKLASRLAGCIYPLFWFLLMMLNATVRSVSYYIPSRRFAEHSLGSGESYYFISYLWLFVAISALVAVAIYIINYANKKVSIYERIIFSYKTFSLSFLLCAVLYLILIFFSNDEYFYRFSEYPRIETQVFCNLLNVNSLSFLVLFLPCILQPGIFKEIKVDGLFGVVERTILQASKNASVTAVSKSYTGRKTYRGRKTFLYLLLPLLYIGIYIWDYCDSIWFLGKYMAAEMYVLAALISVILYRTVGNKLSLCERLAVSLLSFLLIFFLNSGSWWWASEAEPMRYTVLSLIVVITQKGFWSAVFEAISAKFMAKVKQK